jgi:hypothetical protein
MSKIKEAVKIWRFQQGQRQPYFRVNRARSNALRCSEVMRSKSGAPVCEVGQADEDDDGDCALAKVTVDRARAAPS